MATVHADLIRRHRRILKHQLKLLNEKQGTDFKLGQKNIDVLFYINYIRFVKKLAVETQKNSLVGGSSEVMDQHWKETGEYLLNQFENTRNAG